MEKIKLDSWTQNFIGIISSDGNQSKESYINYLENKYR